MLLLATTSPSHGRDVGPIGTTARIAGGVLLLGWPIASGHIGLWDVAGGLIVLPLLATAIAAGARAGSAPERPGSRRAPWTASGAVLAVVLVLACATALTFVTPVDAPAVWIFLGISMFVAAQRGQGGCEVLALPNLVLRRHDRVACPVYGLLDAAEARHRVRHAADADRVSR